MKKLKVLTVVGTRPEIIRLSQVLLKLDEVYKNTANISANTENTYFIN